MQKWTFLTTFAFESEKGARQMQFAFDLEKIKPEAYESWLRVTSEFHRGDKARYPQDHTAKSYRARQGYLLRQSLRL